VGNPGVGEIGRAILSNLQQAPIQCDVIELNWNRITDKPLSSEGTLDAKAVGVLQAVLTAASSLASDALGTHLKRGKLGRVWDLQKYLFSCADLTITFAFALIIASPAILSGCAGAAAFTSTVSSISVRC